MLKALECSEASLSLDTRLCQTLFDKLRKCSRFALIVFVDEEVKKRKPLGKLSHKDISSRNKHDAKFKYTEKLLKFAKIVNKILTNCHEVLQNFHSRLLDNISHCTGNKSKSMSKMKKFGNFQNKSHKNFSKAYSSFSDKNNTYKTNIKHKSKNYKINPENPDVDYIKEKVRNEIYKSKYSDSKISQKKRNRLNKIANHETVIISDFESEHMVNKITHNILKELHQKNISKFNEK